MLRKRRRESAGPSPPATQVAEAADAPLGDAPDSAATTNESDGVVVVRKCVVPALHYVNTKIFGECINQVFGLIHVQGNGVDEADVDRLISRYRFFGLSRLTGLPAKMKEELPAYREAVAMIKPLEKR